MSPNHYLKIVFSQELVIKLQSQIGDYQQEIITIKRRLAEAEVAAANSSDGASGGGTQSRGAAEHERFKRQQDSFEKESRLQMAQINKLATEKDLLEQSNSELKEAIILNERTIK
jgi:hypothetical protein